MRIWVGLSRNFLVNDKIRMEREGFNVVSFLQRINNRSGSVIV